jgi:hypothetical protein
MSRVLEAENYRLRAALQLIRRALPENSRLRRVCDLALNCDEEPNQIDRIREMPALRRSDRAGEGIGD